MCWPEFGAWLGEIGREWVGSSGVRELAGPQRNSVRDPTP